LRLLLVAALILAGCRHEEPKAAIGWRPVGSWSGRGSTQTDSFNIESGQWRIKWKTSGSGRFQAVVHSAVSGRWLMSAVDNTGTGKGVAFVNEDPRLFFVEIESDNVDWSINVEEAVAGFLK
jgi:hypothetical protein